MNFIHSLHFKILLCIFIGGTTLYHFVDKQNELTELRREIPALSKEVKSIHEENKRYEYEIDRFESPIHLMELARKPEFGHLKYPYQHEVIILQGELIVKDSKDSLKND